MSQKFKDDGDGLLMQKTIELTYWEEMNIHFKHTRKIAELVKKDWEDVN